MCGGGGGGEGRGESRPIFSVGTCQQGGPGVSSVTHRPPAKEKPRPSEHQCQHGAMIN